MSCVAVQISIYAYSSSARVNALQNPAKLHSWGGAGCDMEGSCCLADSYLSTQGAKQSLLQHRTYPNKKPPKAANAATLTSMAPFLLEPV